MPEDSPGRPSILPIFAGVTGLLAVSASSVAALLVNLLVSQRSCRESASLVLHLHRLADLKLLEIIVTKTSPETYATT